MTCARRGAGAHRLAASASSRSPSSRRTPPEGRSRPDPLGGRTRLSRLLPVLALLLGALGLFAAAPAQAQTTVWSATLTVDQASLYHGCGYLGMDACSSALTEDEFSYGGTDYTIKSVVRSGHLWLVFESPVTPQGAKTGLTGLTLTVGTGATARTYSVADAFVLTVGGALDGLRWTSPPSWSDGNTVAMKLTAPATTTKPAKPTGLSATAGNAQVALSWTDPSNTSITSYQYQQKAGSAAWGSWTTITGSGATTTSHTVTSLSNGTAYRFRIRAVNSAGNSPQSDIAGPVTPAAPPADGASFTAAASGWFKPGDTVSVRYRITIASGDRNQALKAVIYRSANCSGNNPVAYSNTATNVATLTTAGQHTFTANLTVKSGVATASSNLCAWVGSSARWIARLPLTNFKVDATDPGISFPSSPAVPRVGAASTITLSDAHSKIKKYGAIMVDGTSGTAASCDTATEIGTGNLTTETTALATKAFAYTVPSGSVGKKVCAYAEDAAGNINSALWGTAAQMAADNTAPTVSSAGYFSNAAATTALTGPQKAGVDIYTKVTFSEDMNHVKSNADAARPEISYRIGSTDTQYDILNNADALASGDCKPNHASNTNVYVCRYTVGTSVNGAFTVKVGTNSADKATNALASVYTHTATLTLDTTKPAIAFPTAAPKVGVASTITLTDAGAKIKKYKVLEVPGATTAATACDDPSGDSFTPTSLTTAASPKAVSHTPSTGSTGKKLCAYAEDAAGNSNSKLWSAAIQAATAKPAKPTGFTATAGDRRVTLRWTNPNDSTITRWQYRQKRGGGNYGSWTNIPSSSASTVVYIRTGLFFDRLYTFQIRAVNPSGNGVASDEKTATPVPPAISGLSATPGADRVTLSWSNPSTCSQIAGCGYRIRHRTTGGNWSSWTSLGIVASKVVTGLMPGTAYEFMLERQAGSSTTARGTVSATTTSAVPDITGLAVTSSPPASQGGYYKAGNAIAVTVTFDEAITVVGSPTLKMRVGTAEKTATCTAHSSENTRLVCSYTVQSGDADSDGIAVEQDMLAVSSGVTIKDSDSNDAVLTHNALAAQSGHKVDATDPGIAFPAAGPRLGSASTITLTDAGSKIAKYAVLAVPGTASDATGCDDPSASGDNFTTTAVSPAASPKTVSWTPPSDSLGKKACVYAEDVAGNSNSKLWTTAVAAATVTPPPTLTGSKLVSNTGQTKSVDDTFRDQAQSFATGNRSTRLTGVEMLIQHTSTTAPAYSVAIHAESSGSPGSSLGTLTNPASLPATAGGAARYAASGSGILLQANTTYFVVVDVTSPGTGTVARPLTQSNNEDSGAEAGWSIGDGRLHRAHGASTWLTSDHSLKMAVYGRIVTGAPQQLSIPDRPAGPVTLSAANGTSLTLDLETAWRMRGKSVEFRETVLTQAQKTLPAGFWPGGTVMEIDPEVDLQMGENPTVCMPVSSSGETQVLRWDAGRGAWSELTMTSRSASQVCATTVELGLFLAAAGTVTIADKVIRHGYELSDFRAAPEAMRIDVSWSVLNPGTRCRFVVAWREAGTGEWRHEDVFSYHGSVSHGIRGLTEGTSYDVRLFVPAPGSTGDPADADLAYETTVTTKGQSMAPPPIVAAGPALEWARVNAAELALRFDASLDESSVPAGSAFSVSVAGASRAVSAVAVSQETVTLTLASAVSSGEAVTVGYTPPSTGKLRASGGGAEVAAFSGQSVTNDTPVSGLLQQAPPPAPLTASVASAPAEHKGKGKGKGKGKFTVKVAFSAPVKGKVRAAAGTIQVTGGTLKRVRRAGGADRWALDIQPSSNAAVTLTLPATTDCTAAGAICTADGRKLGTALTHTVPGPASLSVADASAQEGPGATIDFPVTLSRAASGPVTVRYATRDGTAKRRRDYRKTSGTLTFAAGETSKTVSVVILDDAHDEGTETFTLRLSKPKGAAITDGEATGTITNADPLQRDWLARFGRAAAADAVAAVTARLETPRDAGSHVTLGGHRLALGGSGGKSSQPPEPAGRPGGASWLSWSGEPAGEYSSRAMSGRELLMGTSFRAVLGNGAGPQWTGWGQGASVSAFSSAGPGLSLSGETATGSMGMDYEWGRLLTGFAMTHSLGEGTAEGAGRSYVMGSTVTTMLPYLRVALSERVSAWGLAGTGTGRLTLDLAGGAPERYGADLTMSLAAMGVRGDLVTPAEAGGFALALKADAFWVRTESDAVSVPGAGNLAAARGEASRLRAVLDGSRSFALAGGATLTPSVAFGVRHDGGDAETGTGLEFGAGLGYAAPSRGLDMALRVHGLASHAEDGYGEWGVSGSLRLVPGAAGRGLSMSLTPSYGADPGGPERLWMLPDVSGLAATDGADPSGRLDAELGYGLALFGGGFTGTPHVGLGLSETDREVRMGWRLSPADDGDFSFRMDASRRDSAGDGPEHRIGFGVTARW